MADGSSNSMLGLILAMVRGSDTQIGVTVHVPGGIITGLAVNTRRYLDATATSIEGGGELADSVSEMLRTQAGKLAMIDPDAPLESPTMLYLMNARAALPDGSWTPPMPMAITLATVSAFILGNVVSIEYEPDEAP